MMTDFVDQNMPDEMAEAFSALGPLVQNGAAKEENHIRQGAHIRHAFACEIDALVKTG